MKKVIYSLLFLSFSLVNSASETEFDRVLNELLKDCPQLEVLKKNNEATIEVEKALNKISSPEVSMEHVWGRNGVGNKFDLGINQQFDWPLLYKARAAAITAQTNANILLEQSNLLEKTIEIRSIMVDIIFQKKIVELSTSMHEHMTRLEEASKESLERGEISTLEFKRTQLERIQTSIQLRENERMLSELYSQLESATGKEDCKSIMGSLVEVPKWQIHAEDEYELQLSSLDPRMTYLKAVEKAVSASSHAERLASSLPSFNLGYAFQREQGETFNGFNLAITLPIYGSSHVKNASRANIIAAQLETQIEQIALLTKMRNRRHAALSLARELEDYAVIFENGNYSELLKYALEGGQIDSIHYLQELNYYIEVTKQYLELQHQYNLALVSLNRYDIFENR